jgi:hypothetical protein
MSRTLLHWLLVCCLAVGVSGCSLDFFSAVPCTNDDECPTDYLCDVVIARCTQGDGTPVDDTRDEDDSDNEDILRPIRDIAEEDADVADGDDDVEDGSSDTSDVDDTGDGETDSSDVSPTDGSGGPTDTCVPSTEVCDGLDNDCDGVPDDGLTCAGCGDDMVQITPASGASFCIDRWEASRPDATDTAEGVDESRATSRPGVLPWRFVLFAAAEAACTSAGKRICEASEWQRACSGPEVWSYPYNARIYAGQTCNGLNTPPLSSPATTGFFVGCVSPDGVLDMSGNVSEWTMNRFPSGGAYDDVSQNLRCQSENRAVNPAVSEPQAGFRCCRSL